MKMKGLAVIILLNLILILPLAVQADETSEYAVQLLATAMETDWNPDKSFFPKLCESIRDMASANPQGGKEWEKFKKFGKLLKTVEVKESTYDWSGGGPQVDITAKVEKSDKPVVFRFWLKKEGNALCMYGHNFFKKYD